MGDEFGCVCIFSQSSRIRSRKSEAGPVQFQDKMERLLLLPQWPGIGKGLGLVKVSDV